MTAVQPKILIVIPAYKPSETLLEIVGNIKVLAPTLTIVVIDDGSPKSHQHIFDSLLKADVAIVLRHAVNLGKGAALKTAMNYAILKGDIQTIVTADADGQHHAGDVVNLANMSKADPESLLLGVRSFGPEVPLRSRFGNILTRNVLRLLQGLRISDTQTGLRAIPQRSMREFLKIQSNRYEFELECLLLARQWGTNIKEIPIRTIYINENSSSHFNPLVDSLKIYFVFLRFSLSSLSCAVIDFTLFCVLYGVSENLLSSIVFSRLVSATVNFMAARELVFKSSGKVGSQVIQYVGLATTILTVNFVAMSVLVESLELNVLLAKMLVEITLFFASFAIQNIFIFKRAKLE